VAPHEPHESRMRIVQLANLHSATSGGLRTCVNALGRAYVGAGHERVLVVPGRRSRMQETESGLVVTVAGQPVGSGYRVICRPGPVLRLLERLSPDSVEVSDKATLIAAGRWARENGVRSVLLSHERLDAILAPRVPGWLPVERLADRWNGRLAGTFDTVVVASAFAEREFVRIGAPSVHRIPLGVDLEVFRPQPRLLPSDPPGAAGTPVRLLYVGRLSPEKRPDLAIGAVRVLHRRGVPVRLDMLGDGPLRPRLERMAAALPVAFRGRVDSRYALARRVGAADVALAPCPVESFGLSVLEALACGTPVVTTTSGAAQELLAPGAGLAVPVGEESLADGVEAVLSWPVAGTRQAARRRAEEFPWSTTARRMLAVHETGTPTGHVPGGDTAPPARGLAG